jgi:Uncharacterised nucleotidyltransferase
MTGDLAELDQPDLDEVAELALASHLGPAVWQLLGETELTRFSVGVAARLQSNYWANVGRMLRVRQQLSEALSALNHYEVRPLLFKGSLYLAEGTFADIGSRVLSDLDLLVEPADTKTAIEALTGIGYQPLLRPFGRGHELVVAHPSHLVPIEVHLELGTDAVCAVLPSDRMLHRATTVEVDGVSWRRPEITDLLVHHVLHTQIADRNWACCSVSLRQLHTYDTVVRRHGDQVDWSQVDSTMRSHGYGEAYEGYRRMARFFFETPFGHSDRAPAPRALDRRWLRDQACRCNAALENRPSNIWRNLSWALDGDYLLERYGVAFRGPLTIGFLRARHLVGLLGDGSAANFTKAVADHW